MQKSGLARFLEDTDKIFRKSEKETNALISEMTKQMMFPSFNSHVIEYATYDRRPEIRICEKEQELTDAGTNV